MTVVGREIGPALAIFRPKANFEGTPLGADGATDPVERNAIHDVTLDAVSRDARTVGRPDNLARGVDLQDLLVDVAQV